MRLAGPSSGPSHSAAAASLSSGLPFLIVRKEAKEYGTANRLEGFFEPGERVCLVEDVVTSAGAAIEAVEALRGGRPEGRNGGLRGRPARRVERTLWRAPACACARSSDRPSC